MKFTKFGILCVNVFSILTFYINAHAAPGDLDMTFGTGGITMSLLDVTDSAVKPTIQPDGKIVVAGVSITAGSSNNFNVSLARYNTDGSLDSGFATNGKIIVEEVGNQFTRSLLIQSNGKILTLGYEELNPSSGDYSMIIHRFNSNGTLDTGFGIGGKVIHSIQNRCQALDAVLQPDGKIIVAGMIMARFAVFRLNTDGSLDTSFNLVGYNNTTNTTGTPVYATAVALQSDGKIVVGGANYGAELGQWGRFNSDGAFEGSSLTPTIAVADVAVQSDGKIVFGGQTTASRAAITRFNADKTLDTQFGNAGVTLIIWSSNQVGSATSLFIRSNGQIVVGGYTYAGYYDSALARFNSNGFLDVGFGNGGKVVTQIGISWDQINGMAQQTDGKIITVGSARNATDNSVYFVARYDNSNSNTLANRTPFDFDGDGRADVSVLRPSENTWYQILSGNSSYKFTTFGSSGDLPAPADYDGDGKTDIAIFRPWEGQWWFATRINGENIRTWGQAGDIPLPSDFDGDGTADLVVYRPSTNTWLRRTPLGQSANVQFGSAGDKPLIGDFDGDGKSDPAVYRPTTGVWWYAASSANGQHRAVQWGVSDDIPVPADYDGDRKTDFAVYRPSEGVWYILNSSGTYTYMQFGLSGDKPVSADYDGDGKADIAVYRPSNGVWYQMRSTAGFNAIQWGISTDIPSENAFIP